MSIDFIRTTIRAAAVAALSATASCSSGTTAGTASGTPATIGIAGGDGQSGIASAALPVAPVIVVRDGSGAPVVGASVVFVIDSGGGTIAHGTATTGPDGTASAGTWTLGSSAGMNVLTARVGSAGSAVFHAQALSPTARTIFNATPVGAGGGTLTYTTQGDPLNGLSVVIPAGSYSSSTSWTVVADSTITIPAQAGFTQAGPALIIGNGQGYSDSMISVTVPMRLATTDIAQAFYYDPASGTLEPIPVVGQTDTSATLATTHFSHDLMALPANGPSATGLRQSLRSGFGNVVVVWSVSKPESLIGTYTTSFAPGQDDWEFDNFGDYISPDGNCEGMEVTALFYRYFVSNQGRPTLYHHFDKSLANIYDNVNAVRFTGSVQGDIDASITQHLSQTQTLIDVDSKRGGKAADLAASRLILTLKRTHQPVLIGLRGVGFGHAVIAYAATATANQIVVSISDPNMHGAARQMEFDNNVLKLFTIAGSVADAPAIVNAAYALGVTAELPLTAINQRWNEFLAKTAGADRYPASYTFEVFDSLNNTWRPLGDTVQTTINVFRTRVRCPSCPQPIPGADPADAQHTSVFNDSGTVKLATEGVDILLNPGATGYVVNAYATNPRAESPFKFAFLDSRSITVKYFPFTIFPRNGGVTANVPATFAAVNGGVMNSQSRFTWNFGDGTAVQTVVGDSLVKHTFTRDSAFTVSVEFRSADGTLLGRYSTSTAVASQVGWRVTNAGIATVQLPANGIGPLHADTNAVDSVTAWLGRLHSNPTSNLIFVVDSGGCRIIALEQFPGATIDTGYVASRVIMPLGINQGPCFDPATFTGTATLGTVGSGALVGAMNAVRTDFVQLLGAVNATMTGATLTGTLTVRITYTTGIGTYTVPFVATQILPAPANGLRASPAPGAP